MCNLYNLTTSQEAIRQWTRALRDILGNLEPSIDIYPNQPGPVVRNAPDGTRELANLQEPFKRMLWCRTKPPAAWFGQRLRVTRAHRGQQRSGRPAPPQCRLKY